jgi:hypothetical protein
VYEGILLHIHSIIQWGRISLQEGALFIVDLVIWSVRSLPTARRFITGVLYHPIYRFAVGFSDLEAKEEEAEFLACFSQRGRTLLEKTSPTARERVGSWRSLVFSLGRLLVDHIFFFLLYFGGIISHTHYSAIYDPDLLYYCMEVSYL